MSSAYYSTLSLALQSLQNSLPSGLEPAEKEAVVRTLQTLQNWIARQIQEISTDEARDSGL